MERRDAQSLTPTRRAEIPTGLPHRSGVGGACLSGRFEWSCGHPRRLGGGCVGGHEVKVSRANKTARYAMLLLPPRW